MAETKPLGLGIVAAAALAGGVAVGSAIAVSMREGWIEEPKLIEDPSPEQELMQFGVANVALVLGGDLLRSMIVDMGRDKFIKTMLTYGGALLAFKLVVDGVRYIKDRKEG
jgi:hypothetical protein